MPCPNRPARPNRPLDLPHGDGSPASGATHAGDS